MKRARSILRQPFYTFEKFDKPMRDYWGKRIARPISIHKLQSSIEAIQYGQGPLSPFLKDLETLFGTSGKPLKKVRIELFQEGAYQWVFLVSASWARTATKTVVLLLAKDGMRLSSVAQGEWNMLQVLYSRNPKQVCKPILATTIPVQSEKGREDLFGYYTELIPDFTELGIDAEHRFYLVGIQRVERLNLNSSELMRARILELLASLYDPETGSALVDVEVNSGDFLGRIKEGSIEVRLIAVRRLRTGMAPAGLLRALLRPMGQHAEANVFLYPETPRKVVESLLHGLKKAYKGDKHATVMALRKGLKKNMTSGAEIPREGITWKLLLDALDKIEPPPNS